MNFTHQYNELTLSSNKSDQLCGNRCHHFFYLDQQAIFCARLEKNKIKQIEIFRKSIFLHFKGISVSKYTGTFIIWLV